jgi:hypothetical protein
MIVAMPAPMYVFASVATACAFLPKLLKKFLLLL